jgi:hypothetical protein
MAMACCRVELQLSSGYVKSYCDDKECRICGGVNLKSQLKGARVTIYMERVVKRRDLLSVCPLQADKHAVCMHTNSTRKHMMLLSIYYLLRHPETLPFFQVHKVLLA